MQNQTQKSNRLWLWIIFIVYPLGSFVYSVKNFDNKKYRIFILMFFMFYGFTFLPIAESDGARYQDDFATTRDYTFAKYFKDLADVFKGDSTYQDFYAPTLKFVVHTFTDNPRFYFLFAAFIYFFVFLKLLDSIWELVSKDGGKFFVSFFIGCCFIYNLSAGVNGIRFPLAFMVFSYGAFNLAVTNKRKYLLIALLSILIHFSFLFSSAILLLYYLFNFKRAPWGLYIILVLAVVFSTVFPSFIQENLSFLGKVTETKLDSYTQEGFVESREEHLQAWNWYIYFNFYGSYLFTILALFLTRVRFFKIKVDATSEKLFILTFFMLINSVLAGSIVDEISNRFSILFSLFAVIYLLYLSVNNYSSRFMNFLNYVYIPILILNILVKLRADLYTFNTVVFIGNVVSLFFTDIKISIQDLLLG